MRAHITLTLATLLVVLGLATAQEAGEITAAEAVDAWQQIDDLNDAKDFDGAFALLEPLAGEHGSDVGYLWRMARHHFNVSDNTTDEAVIEKELYTGFEFAQQALAADSGSSWAHGYYGILIGRVRSRVPSRRSSTLTMYGTTPCGPSP